MEDVATTDSPSASNTERRKEAKKRVLGVAATLVVIVAGWYVNWAMDSSAVVRMSLTWGGAVFLVGWSVKHFKSELSVWSITSWCVTAFSIGLAVIVVQFYVTAERDSSTADTNMLRFNRVDPGVSVEDLKPESHDSIGGSPINIASAQVLMRSNPEFYGSSFVELVDGRRALVLPITPTCNNVYLDSVNTWTIDQVRLAKNCSPINSVAEDVTDDQLSIIMQELIDSGRRQNGQYVDFFFDVPQGGYLLTYDVRFIPERSTDVYPEFDVTCTGDDPEFRSVRLDVQSLQDEWRSSGSNLPYWCDNVKLTLLYVQSPIVGGTLYIGEMHLHKVVP
jgi:hypothetical protein